MYSVVDHLEVDAQVVRWDLALSALLEDLPQSENLVCGGFASNKPSLVDGDTICSKERKSSELDLGEDLVGGIEDCGGSKVRAFQPVALFVDCK